MKFKYSILQVVFIVSLCAFAIPSDAFRKKHYNIDKSALALEGYDPVAYIVSKKAMKGNSTFSYTYHSIKYHFSTKGNLEKFKTSSDIYEPAYGGWCAYAMGNSGEKVEVDPETFKIINGKTYLFYNAYFNNTKTKWDVAESVLKRKADANWPKLLK